MNGLMIFLRLVHIFSGVFWVGTSFFVISFLNPSVKATGEDGQKFMRQLGFKTRFSLTMLTVAILTVLSGFLMYWQISGFRMGWIRSGYGLMLTLGAVFGLLGLLSGYYYQFRNIQKMKALSAELQAGGGPPSPEQMERMKAYSENVSKGGMITTLFVTIALIGMSIAQYVTF